MSGQKAFNGPSDEFQRWVGDLRERCRAALLRVERGELPLQQAAAELGMMPEELRAIGARREG